MPENQIVEQEQDLLGDERKADNLAAPRSSRAHLLRVTKAAVAVPLAVLLPCLWLVEFLIFLPFLWRRRSRAPRQFVPPKYRNRSEGKFFFDRVEDISKIYGCETRNVSYEWDIFARAIESRANGQPARALDFGAGSLRDTYELCRLRFRVDAVDKNGEALRAFESCYDWSSVPTQPTIYDGTLCELPSDKLYDVIIAFDVLEHLYDLEENLAGLHGRLREGGLLLATVPNRRSLWERIFRANYRRRVRRSLPRDTSGAPHVQFRTPEEWAEFFLSRGFTIVAHDMGIGFLVNDCWSGFYGIPSRIFIDPVLQKTARLLGLKYQPSSFEELFYPSWLMERVNTIDERLKSRLRHRWGWNLFVLGKAATLNSDTWAISRDVARDVADRRRQGRERTGRQQVGDVR